MAAFSRLQLAAALIEYDNDLANPNLPFRSAQDSAIFAHMRQGNPAAPPRAPSRQSTNLLGVNLPTEAGGSETPPNHNRAQSAMSGLIVNPFTGAVEEEGDGGSHHGDGEEELEVDLTSWGLDGFIPKEKGKGKKKHKGKGREADLPNPHDDRARSQSVDLGRFGAGDAFLDSASNAPPARRRSVSSAMEPGRSMSPRSTVSPRPMSSHALIDNLPVTPPLHAVPFPSQSVRSVSPGPTIDGAAAARAHGRTYSTASWGSRAMLNDVQEEEGERNPFELEPPPANRASRFDPKTVARARTASIGSMGSRALLDDFADGKENTFAVRPPSPSRSSRFDPKARSRVMSTASMGSRMMLDDGASVMTGARQRPMSTMDMLRPKVLVMPSPLQGVEAPTRPTQSLTMREGFQVIMSADGTPLPPGARAGRSSTTLMNNIQPSATAVPIASNSFTPNPRANLTLSQLIFRNQLMVDGQRDVAYADIDGGLERATEDGQQIMAPPDEEEPVRPVSVVVDEFAHRPAGKLFGKSLVDELEERKAIMRNKQRVFTGDSRPSMMSRPQPKRASTLIDPASLQRPGTQLMENSLQRRNSTGPKPLLDFGGEQGELGPPRRPGPMSASRSVFGVDTLWEKEMAKLKEIEAREAAEREEEERREKAVEAKKSKKKGKGKASEVPPQEPQFPEAEPRVSMAPPVLPDIPRNVTRGPPPPATGDESDDDDTDSDSTGVEGGKASAPQWFAGASDDGHGDGPLRTTGVGLRYPHGRPRATSAPKQLDDDSDEEDVPLAATVDRAYQRQTQLQSTLMADDSDEDKPLSTVLPKKHLDVNFDNLSPTNRQPIAADEDEDEDNQPLGLRASRVLPSASQAGDSDEDDKPLGLHPQQQLRTQQQQQQQYQMLAAQQQALALQQQMTASMMFSNPSLMGSGYFGPQMGMVPPAAAMMGPNMMMMPPPISGSPPPPQDPAKFSRVDQWRRGVPVDG